MKAIFVIIIVFACSVCEVTSLECYQCQYFDETLPNCDSQERVTCSEKYKFCGKVKNDGVFSVYVSSTVQYIGKGCLKYCTKNGYLWYWGTFITCCQGDYCNV